MENCSCLHNRDSDQRASLYMGDQNPDKMEDEDERLYCSDNGEYYEPGKPNYPALVLMVIIGGLIWPLALLFGIFIPITFILMDKMGQLHPDDEDFDQDEDNYL